MSKLISSEITVRVKFRHEDWISFQEYCLQLGHGSPTEVCSNAIEMMLRTGAVDLVQDTPEEFTKRSATYWMMFKRQWTYFLLSVGTIAFSHLMLQLPMAEKYAPPFSVLYLVLAAGLVSVVLYALASALESNRLGGPGRDIVRIFRRIEVWWLLPFSLMALSVLLSLLWILIALAQQALSL